jgi:RNase P/RNase MRP subunit p30
MAWEFVFIDEPDEIAKHAEASGCSNYIIACDFPSPKAAEALREKISRSKGGCTFLTCKLLTSGIQKDAVKYRGKADLIAAMPADLASVGQAVNSAFVDFIVQPFSRESLLLDRPSAGMCARNGKPVAFLFSHFLREEGKAGALLMKNAILTSRFLMNRKAQAVVFSGAAKPAEMRAPEDLPRFLELMGFPKEYAAGSVRAFDAFIAKRVK